MIRAMLWNPERLLHALYELRNQGLISKILEIDNIRQFTTKYTLAGVVALMCEGGRVKRGNGKLGMKNTGIIEAIRRNSRFPAGGASMAFWAPTLSSTDSPIS